MNVLTTTGGTQTLKIIPREYIEEVIVTLKNRNTRVVTTYSATTTFNKGYMEITEVFNLVESEMYILEVHSNADALPDPILLYRGQVLCTDQTDFTKKPYSMNKDVYIQAPDNNDIIIF